MHTKKHVLDDFFVFNEKDRVIKEQGQVAEIFNEYFTNITLPYFIVHRHTVIRDQAHINEVPMTRPRPANAFGLWLTNLML